MNKQDNLQNDLPRFASVQYQQQINGLQIELDLADAKTRRRNWMLGIAGVFYAVLVGFLCVATMTNSVVIDFEKGSLPEQINNAKAEVEKMKEFVKDREAEIESWKTVNKLNRKDFEDHKKILLDDLKKAKEKAGEIKEKAEYVAFVDRVHPIMNYLFFSGIIICMLGLVAFSLTSGLVSKIAAVATFSGLILFMGILVLSEWSGVGAIEDPPLGDVPEAQAVAVSELDDRWEITESQAWKDDFIQDIKKLPKGKITHYFPATNYRFGRQSVFYLAIVLERSYRTDFYCVPENLVPQIRELMNPVPPKPRAEY